MLSASRIARYAAVESARLEYQDRLFLREAGGRVVTLQLSAVSSQRR
jgi:hypothetical protein